MLLVWKCDEFYFISSGSDGWRQGYYVVPPRGDNKFLCSSTNRNDVSETTLDLPTLPDLGF
jgi:hypothetical protein